MTLFLSWCNFFFAYVIVTVKISQDNVKEFCIAISYFMIQESLACYIKEFITYIAFTNLWIKPGAEIWYNDWWDEHCFCVIFFCHFYINIHGFNIFSNVHVCIDLFCFYLLNTILSNQLIFYITAQNKKPCLFLMIIR